MARKRQEAPFDKIMTVRSKLHLYCQFGEVALAGQDIKDFMADVSECIEHLMAFRNIINGMVSFEQDPARAVLPYLPDDVIREAAQA